MWKASAPVSEWMVDRIDPQPGQVVLELAAGPGDTGLLAAARLRPGGRLITTDLSPRMVEAALRRAAELGLEDVVEGRVMDAQQIDQEDASVDAVLCRWAVMLLDDPGAGLREMVRVLRPGGAAALAVWAEAYRNPWAFVLSQPLARHGLIDLPGGPGPGPFRLGDRGLLAELATAAGFTHVEVEEIELTWSYPSFDEFWRVTTLVSPSSGRAVREMDDGLREVIRGEAGERLERFRADDGYQVPGVVYALSARAPR
jgi:SAM-dependent methyltransferase